MPFKYKNIDKDICASILLQQHTGDRLFPTDKWQIHVFNDDGSGYARYQNIKINTCSDSGIKWTELDKNTQHDTNYKNIVMISTYNSSEKGGKRKSKKQTKSKKSKKSKKSNKSKKNKNQRK